jgi:hypothetical protein
MPQMKIAVGIWGTIVQNILRLSLEPLTDPVIKTNLPPEAQNLRFSFGKIGAHGKIGMGQV